MSKKQPSFEEAVEQLQIAREQLVSTLEEAHVNIDGTGDTGPADDAHSPTA